MRCMLFFSCFTVFIIASAHELKKVYKIICVTVILTLTYLTSFVWSLTVFVFVKSFRYLGDRLNASGVSEAAVTARTRIGWIKFREGEELLYGRKFSVKMKGRIYQSCVRTAMLYGSETWCLRGNEMAILKTKPKKS